MVARSTLFDGACWDPQHWTYLAEGAANVLIRYIGPETGPFVGFNGTYRIALRLPKIQYNRPPSKTLQPDIFIERVLSKLLPVDTLPVLYRIPNENEMHSFLREIKSKCEPLRPASRRKTGSIDPDAPYIWATHDLSNVPDAKVGLVIEPKCGYIFDGPTAIPFKREYSRYRMLRIHKTSKSLTASETEQKPLSITRAEFDSFYDPLDWYSDDPIRIRRALQALCNDWMLERANNFFVWYRGRQVTIHQDATLLQQITGAQHSDPTSICEALVNLLTKVILAPIHQNVLQIMVNQQRRLDPIGIEGLSESWHRIAGSRLENYDSKSSSPTMNMLLAPPTLEEFEFAASYPVQQVRTAHTLRQAIVSHLLSATLKDASLFLQLDDVNSPFHWVDLDPKPAHKLPGYAIADWQIAESFARWAETHPNAPGI